MKISHKEKAEILFLFVSFPTPLSLSLSASLFLPDLPQPAPPQSSWNM